jgi:hypothetical protein
METCWEMENMGGYPRYCSADGTFRDRLKEDTPLAKDAAHPVDGRVRIASVTGSMTAARPAMLNHVRYRVPLGR